MDRDRVVAVLDFVAVQLRCGQEWANAQYNGSFGSDGEEDCPDGRNLARNERIHVLN